MKLLKLALVVVIIVCGSNAYGQAKYMKALSKIETEQDVQQLKKKHPKWDITIVELLPTDSLNQSKLFNMKKNIVNAYGDEGKAYKVLEEKRRLVMIKFEPNVEKDKKKYDY